MTDQLVDLINFQQLEVLGVTKEHITFTILFIILIISSLIIKPILFLLASKNYLFVLTYIMSSLFIITISSLYKDRLLLALTFQVVVFSGLLLSLYLVYRFFKVKLQK